MSRLAEVTATMMRNVSSSDSSARDHEERNREQDRLVRAALSRLRALRNPVNWHHDERRQANRRRGRGGRRRGDLGRQWWQTGIVFAVLCAALRYWRVYRP